MGEPEARLQRAIACDHGNVIGGHDQVSALCLVDGIKECVGIQIAKLLQQFEPEIAADDRRVSEGRPAVFAHPLETPADDETDAFWDIELAHLKVTAPAPLGIEEPALFRQVLEDLLHEERVAFRLTIDRVDQRRWRWLAGERAQHRLNAGLWQRLESDPMGKALPDQRLECPREGASCVKLDVAICSDGEDGHLVLLLGDVLEQHQRGVVCPVQVVQNVEQRQGMTYTLEKLAYAVEEIETLLLGRQLKRRGNVVVYLSQLWKYLRNLTGVLTETGAEAGWPSAQGLLEHFDVRDVGGRAFHLVATPCSVEHAAGAGLKDDLLRQPRLANAGLAADQDDRAVAGDRLLHETAELGALGISADVWGTLREDRSRGGLRLFLPGDF